MEQLFPERRGAEHHGGHPHARPARAGAWRRRCWRSSAPRRLAHRLPRGRRPAHAAGRRRARRAAAGDRSRRPAGGPARGRGAPPGGGGGRRRRSTSSAGPWCAPGCCAWARRSTSACSTVHHLVTDWISSQIAWGELVAIYDALARGESPALPEPPVQYPDFAVWQRGWLQGEVLAELTSWWRERLAGFPVALDLPTDRPRPALLRMRGGRRPLTVSASWRRPAEPRPPRGGDPLHDGARRRPPRSSIATPARSG